MLFMKVTLLSIKTLQVKKQNYLKLQETESRLGVLEIKLAHFDALEESTMEGLHEFPKEYDHSGCS